MIMSGMELKECGMVASDGRDPDAASDEDCAYENVDNVVYPNPVYDQIKVPGKSMSLGLVGNLVLILDISA